MEGGRKEEREKDELRKEEKGRDGSVCMSDSYPLHMYLPCLLTLVWMPACLLPPEMCAYLPGICRYLPLTPAMCSSLLSAPGICAYLPLTPGMCTCLPLTPAMFVCPPLTPGM